MYQSQIASEQSLDIWRKLEKPEQKATTQLYSDWLHTARDKQLTPNGDWFIWLILAGRGWGKTRTGASDIATYALTYPNSICAVVVPTFGDIRRVAFGGPSGLLSIIPRECLLKGRGRGYNASSAEITLFNGSKIIGFSAEEPERLRGPQFHRAWCDEIAAWKRPETFDQLMFGLRLGSERGTSPQCVITTTPKPTPIIRGLVKRDDTHVTTGSTFENEANLAEAALRQLEEKYGGTRLGRQELYAEVLDEVEGALWTHSMIDAARITEDEMPDLDRIVVAIDPAVTAGEDSDETGIIVAGRGGQNEYYVIEDATLRASPDTWARTAVDLYYRYNADRIVAEVNNGGDLVEKVIRNIDRGVPYKAVNASRGKLVRAEPVAALYEQGKVHHVGGFPQLEDQMTTFSAGSRLSPDRMDALVWAIQELSLSSGKVHWRIS